MAKKAYSSAACPHTEERKEMTLSQRMRPALMQASMLPTLLHPDTTPHPRPLSARRITV